MPAISITSFYVTQFFHHRLHKVQQFIYPLFAEENWNIKQILLRVFMPWLDQTNTKKKINCIGHIVYKNNTRQRLVSLFKLPSKLFIIFVFV